MLSTMHDQPVILNNEKPEMVACYTKVQGAVDTFNQIRSDSYLCRQKTRWSLCLFFGMLNAASINAFLIYNKMQKNRGQQVMDHKDFMIKLAEDLIFPLGRGADVILWHAKKHIKYNQGCV